MSVLPTVDKNVIPFCKCEPKVVVSLAEKLSNWWQVLENVTDKWETLLGPRPITYIR